MKFEQCELYQLVETYDNYGRTKNDYEKITNISVCINTNRVYKTIGNEVYTITEPTAISSFINLEFNAQYKLVVGGVEYEVTSFQLSNRFAIMQIKGVDK